MRAIKLTALALLLLSLGAGLQQTTVNAQTISETAVVEGCLAGGDCQALVIGYLNSLPPAQRAAAAVTLTASLAQSNIPAARRATVVSGVRAAANYAPADQREAIVAIADTVAGDGGELQQQVAASVN